MMQASFALLGHLRGGPAKVAVVSSALNGLVSGSSISNVVSGGIFTIPMMRRTGLSAVKAGAIETASSINSQLMPPVMGAAAFLMVKYVGIPYPRIIKHAFLPAVVSYIAHLEAVNLTRNRLWETAALLLAAFTLMRPGFWMDRLVPPYADTPPSHLQEVVGAIPRDGRLQLRIRGLNLEGDEVEKTVSLRLGGAGEPADRLAAARLTLRVSGEEVRIERVQFRSYAQRLRIEPGFRVTAVLVPADRPSPFLFYIPALLLLGLVVAAQRVRVGAAAASPSLPAG